MHNRSLTVDGCVTILGGRNIGDICFATGAATHCIDLDALALGAVAQEGAQDFVRYWASSLAFPVDQLVRMGHGPPVQ